MNRVRTKRASTFSLGSLKINAHFQMPLLLLVGTYIVWTCGVYPGMAFQEFLIDSPADSDGKWDFHRKTDDEGRAKKSFLIKIETAHKFQKSVNLWEIVHK